MIQRIQSVWLLLAAATEFAGLKLPFYSGTDPQGIPSSTLEATDKMSLLVPTIAIAVVALVSVFLFRNRSTQFKLTIAAIVLQLGLIFLYYQESTKYLQGTFALTSILQVAVVIFLTLAALGIRKDENIIRDSNRLR